MTQATFDAVLDACYSLPSGIEAESVSMPGAKCRDIEIRLADRVSGRSQTLRIDPTADPADFAGRIREAADNLLARSQARGPVGSGRNRPGRPAGCLNLN